MSLIELLKQRRSHPSRQLLDPGPDAAQLRELVDASLRARANGLSAAMIDRLEMGPRVVEATARAVEVFDEFPESCSVMMIAAVSLLEPNLAHRTPVA